MGIALRNNPDKNYLNLAFHKIRNMKSVLLPDQLHFELKAEAQRLGRSLGDVIGQQRLERERLRELAVNLQHMPVKGQFSVVSDASHEVIVLECIERYKLDRSN